MSQKDKKSSKSQVPNDFNERPFYGMRLDEYQVKFANSIIDPNKSIIFSDSKSGSGKTTIALGVANILVQEGKYDEILYIASPVQEQRQGFLPGDQSAKNAPYLDPLIKSIIAIGLNPNTVLKSDDDYENQKNGTAYIQFMTHTYLRGSNFTNVVVIVDEAQNFEGKDLQKVLTRAHDDCKVIVIGHSGQCDLLKPNKSGFVPCINLYESKNDSRVANCPLYLNHRGWISSTADELQNFMKGNQS